MSDSAGSHDSANMPDSGIPLERSMSKVSDLRHDLNPDYHLQDRSRNFQLSAKPSLDFETRRAEEMSFANGSQSFLRRDKSPVPVNKNNIKGSTSLTGRPQKNNNDSRDSSSET